MPSIRVLNCLRNISMPRIPGVFISTIFCLALNSSAVAAVLTYNVRPPLIAADMQTIIYTNKIGSVPVNDGCIEINGRAITVYGRPDQIGDRVVLLSGQLIKPILSNDSTGTHLGAIAYFTDGSLLQKQSRAHQNEIVFIEGGFVSGKIDSFTTDTVLINDHGSPRSVKLSKILAIRSPRVYNLQLDLSANNVEHQYNITNSSLKETVPPQMISPQSIAGKKSTDDDLGDIDDDMLIQPMRGLRQ
jgi:hypothetical protein